MFCLLRKDADNQALLQPTHKLHHLSTECGPTRGQEVHASLGPQKNLGQTGVEEYNQLFDAKGLMRLQQTSMGHRLLQQLDALGSWCNGRLRNNRTYTMTPG